jgi:hypothetical protein
MADDLKLQGYRFNWVLTTFYLAYALVEIPSNIILKRLGANVWLPTLTFLFGVICMGHAFARTFPQLILLRVLLGLSEGGMMPGTAFYLSCFYRREELLFRIGVFATSASLAGAFGGLMAAGLSKVPRWGAAGSELHTWRNIFFFEGLVTMLLSVGAPFLLPRHPGDCRFLTERQKAIAMERLTVEHKGVSSVLASPKCADCLTGGRRESDHESRKEGHFQHQQPVLRVRIRVRQRRSPVHFAVHGGEINTLEHQRLTAPQPTILKDMGYASIQAQLHSVPPYVLACVVAIVVAFASDKHQQRGIYLALFGTIAVIGYSILLTTVSAQSRYAGVFIVALGAFPNGPGFLSWGINSAILRRLFVPADRPHRFWIGAGEGSHQRVHNDGGDDGRRDSDVSARLLTRAL